MLKVTIKSTRCGTLERKVCHKINSIAALWDELNDFERLFELEMKRLPQMNHVHAQYAYRLKASGQNSLSVWHYSVDGAPDRLVAIIQQKEDAE